MDQIKNILIPIAEWWRTLNIPIALKIGLPILFMICLITYIMRRASLVVILVLIGLLAAFFFILSSFIK